MSFRESFLALTSSTQCDEDNGIAVEYLDDNGVITMRYFFLFGKDLGSSPVASLPYSTE